VGQISAVLSGPEMITVINRNNYLQAYAPVRDTAFTKRGRGLTSVEIKFKKIQTPAANCC